ncbi:hypothetical protein BDV96DRAFT_357304 [Lophiotrema nucula]|uniref:Uncharacterized protein n=1 Tax=Lophiotrema nucula TaxID=690887 RepID=A0A6A5YG78_9PLEO|nr:hypothetical protein BDV96DRAFT_357304 [Lophiotrema nucula]
MPLSPYVPSSPEYNVFLSNVYNKMLKEVVKEIEARHDNVTSYLYKEISLRKADCKSLQAVNSSLQAVNSSLQADHDSLQADHDSLQAKHKELHADYNCLRANYNSFQADSSSLQAYHARELTYLMDEYHEEVHRLYNRAGEETHHLRCEHREDDTTKDKKIVSFLNRHIADAQALADELGVDLKLPASTSGLEETMAAVGRISDLGTKLEAAISKLPFTNDEVPEAMRDYRWPEKLRPAPLSVTPQACPSPDRKLSADVGSVDRLTPRRPAPPAPHRRTFVTVGPKDLPRYPPYPSVESCSSSETSIYDTPDDTAISPRAQVPGHDRTSRPAPEPSATKFSSTPTHGTSITKPDTDAKCSG